MEHLNKLDCEYTLEEAKDVDVSDITTHPFFKKHFAGADSQPSTASPSRQVYAIQDKEQPHVSHYITHILPDHDHIGHAVEIETQHYGRTKHIGGGRGMTVHEAMDNAVHTYTHPLKIKPLTESLVSKKPATASKLFAEEMAARLDEISKKTLGSYIKKAHEYNDKVTADFMSPVRSIDEPKNLAKARKRVKGLRTAFRKLTKEDLDEVEVPANFWNAGMARMNPIQVSQKQPAEPGQFKATLSKSPTRLADQSSALEGETRTVRDETADVATSRGPKTIELTGDWHADVPDHEFDPKLDSETEYYPLFSQFKSLGAYPSGPARAWEEEEIGEEELNEISKKTLASYVKKASRQARDNDFQAGRHAILGALHGNDYSDHDKHKRISTKRQKGIEKATDKLAEDSASLMATATKDEKKAAEQDKKKPVEFKKLHDKHEAEVKSKMKELGEEALDEGLFDPAKQPLLALWDEYARRADAHGSGSRNEILKRIEDHVAKKHGQEGLKKMKLHTDLTNALKHSLSPDKGHLQAILGNMRSRCAMGV